jgi:proteasome lid subunit RPN8/RPN11
LTLLLETRILTRIQQHALSAYPEEGAGFLLGRNGEDRKVKEIIPMTNRGVEGARRNRYLMGPEEYIEAELEAEKRAMDVIGVFHSHPDHPDSPSEFDREWAQPSFSYLITSVKLGQAGNSRCWRLTEDRAHFDEEELRIVESNQGKGDPNVTFFCTPSARR